MRSSVLREDEQISLNILLNDKSKTECCLRLFDLTLNGLSRGNICLSGKTRKKQNKTKLMHMTTSYNSQIVFDYVV